jgi:peptidyl-prolyl cis-trans isomerase D
MAIISTIRNNSWILIVLIGVGLAGFLMMDMFSGNTSVMGSRSTVAGEINGESIDIQDLNRRESIYNFIYGGTGNTYNTKDFLWNHMLEEKILKNKAENLGLGVSRDELMELQFGENLSPVIQARFSNPQTRQINRENLNQIKQAIETDQINADYRQYWAYQETEVVKARLQSKYTTLVNKAIFIPSWLSDFNNEIGGMSKKALYVQLAFDQSDINPEITDDEINAYIQENEKKYRLDEEKRKLAIVDVAVRPTSKDSMDLLNAIESLRPRLAEGENLSLLIEQNEGVFDTAYFLKDELSETITDLAFSLSIDSVYGPYQEDGSYKIMKVVDRKIIPDSVESRHILIQPNSRGIAQAQKTVDSLIDLIQNEGASFDTLALNFGTDATATLGGDLGYTARGQMVKPFNDLIFYYAEPNTLYSVVTQFGVHLVEVTGRKNIENKEAVKLAYLEQAIVPSEETQDQVYERTQQIVRENRNLEDLTNFISNDSELILGSSVQLGENDYFIQLMGEEQISREAIRWAFEEAKGIGAVSEDIYTKQNTVNYFNSNYYIVALESIIPKGLPKAEHLRDEVQAIVLNEKRGEDLLAKVVNFDLNTIAQQYSANIDTLDNVQMTTSFLPKIGEEPEVVAVISSMSPGSTVKHVVGNSGVFAVQVISENQTSTVPGSMASQKKAMYASEIQNKLMENLKEQAEIEDGRAQFY